MKIKMTRDINMDMEMDSGTNSDRYIGMEMDMDTA